MSHSGERNILVLHTGGLGDLVLLSEFLASVPDARVTLVCRAEFQALVQFHRRPPDDVIPLPFNPYGCLEPEPGLLSALEALLEPLRAVKPDLVVPADLHLTWFDWFIAAALGAARSIACSTSPRPRGLLPILLDRFALGERRNWSVSTRAA